jgi:Zn-dependent protease with chaperone function
MKQLSFLLFFCWIWGASYAQDQDYHPLECSGEIPREWLTSSSAKYEREVNKIKSQKVKGRKKKDRKQYALETSYILDDLLQTGLVLFNDSLSNYFNDVVNVFQETGAVRTRQTVTVYTLRSPAVNAFATARGNVFVTMGLLAQVENEAQLAFILAHELVHVMEKHNLKMYLEAVDIDRQSRRMGSRRRVLENATFDQAIIAKNNYSKELESEADEKGLDLFLQTNYSTATLNTVFDVLKYAYLPFDDVPFDRSFFERPNYSFPEEYWLEEINPIQGVEEDEDDSKSTHPNLKARRTAAGEIIEKADDKGKSNFLVSEDRFKRLQRFARMEIPMLYLHNEDFGNAIYTAYLLLREEPQNQYLKKVVAKSLYLLAKYKNDSRSYSLEPDYKAVEGESQAVFYFLEEMPDEEMTLLALRYVWELSLESPDDREVLLMVEDLFTELAKHQENLDPFLKELSAEKEEVVEMKEEKMVKEPKSKYEKIREKKEQKEEIENDAYWRYVFMEFLGDEAFVNAFEAGQERMQEREELEAYYDENYREIIREERKQQKKGRRLGIEKIAVVNPFYLQLDETNENGVEFLKTEFGQGKFREVMEEVAPVSDLDIEILDVENLRKSHVETFNDIRHLNEWFSEQVRHDDLTLTPGNNQNQIDQIAQTYGTDYFLWMGIITLKGKKKFPIAEAVLGVLYPPVLIMAIAKGLKPNNETMIYAILFDVTSGKREILKYDIYDRKDSGTMLKAHVYDVFAQIKTEKE